MENIYSKPIDIIEIKFRRSMPGHLNVSRDKELNRLKRKEMFFIKSIRHSKKFRTRDYLKLLPTIKLEQRPVEQYNEWGYVDSYKTETFVSFSFNLSSAFHIFDTGREREVKKLKGERRAISLCYRIKNTINKKYNYLNQAYRLEQKRDSSKEDLKKLEYFDEKLSNIYHKISETAINIEALFAEIEYLIYEIRK